MTYHGAHLRYASEPWGPWQLVDADPPGTIFDFDDARDGGKGVFIHMHPDANAHVDDGVWAFPDFAPSVQYQPFLFRPDSWGTAYAPYLISRWLKSDETSLTLFYTLSTWRPYQTVLMRTTLDIECR